MNEGGGYGADIVPHFNGGLFADPVALAIDSDTMDDMQTSTTGRTWSPRFSARYSSASSTKALGSASTTRCEYIETLVEPVGSGHGGGMGPGGNRGRRPPPPTTILADWAARVNSAANVEPPGRGARAGPGVWERQL
ncbi:MAG: hypothetical protein U5Q44_08320 [Dehalococcoidia bacterium]|nr:hypothetical protein [Dehalococcoidia bacterium]